MRRPSPRTRRLLASGAVAVAAAAVAGIALLLPPRAVPLRQPEWRPAGTTWRGAMHVHTQRSDGSGTIDEVATAAARAGLQFVILTDHGDGTRPPDPPRYRSGTLVLDGVEIGTNAGHYVAVGMRQAPYPLGGDTRDVVEDVARLGGFGVIAHPDSGKGDQPWKDWDLPVDGMEWLNADSQWRDEGVRRLARAVLTYPFRPAETLARQLNQSALLSRWDQVAASRPVVALAGADAHARLGVRAEGDPYKGRIFLPLPSYEASFRSFSLQVVTSAPRTGRAHEDARQVLAALRAGRVHTVIDGWASPAAFEFSVRGEGIDVPEGGRLATSAPVVIRVRSNAPLYATVALIRDGVEVHRVDRQSLVYATDRPGRYRAEIWLNRSGRRMPVPWIVTNAITIGPAATFDGVEAASAATPAPNPIETVPARWHVEHAPGSVAELVPAGGAAAGAGLRFRLAPGPASGQFSAIVSPIEWKQGARALVFRAQAERPMRVSVQLRAPSSAPDGERWQRSVYLDSTPRELRIPLESMRPAGATASARPSPSADNLLFVVDTVNTLPGTTGRFTVSNIGLERPRD